MAGHWAMELLSRWLRVSHDGALLLNPMYLGLQHRLLAGKFASWPDTEVQVPLL